ncbi:hypothetical protein F935_00313 [Acinetobacter calcoaceticus ANC 3811]|uniref:HEAT repeat domain-containing protein n=1 Tax=Acinetobacter calcoaceticus ANC 3811 TaxID=1217690 RepID=R8Y5J0_ACICA|nr:hypothetical protein [Acinetobacter calcoaceticus]EOQ64663.1 hypothetical protein F935_00313 [Acinetobacter calcoaceticus ANC 3811]
MELDEVGHYVNFMAEGAEFDPCSEEPPQERLYQALREDEDIAKKFVIITNTHAAFIQFLEENEDYWQFFDEGCMKWQSCITLMAMSEYYPVRIRAVDASKLIAHQLKHDSNPNVRAACVSRSTNIANELMHDEHRFVRAACALQSESLGLALMHDTDDLVREYCTKWEACAKNYVEDTCEAVRWHSICRHPHLAKCFIYDPSPTIRKLCFHKDTALVELLKDDADNDVRMKILVEHPEMAQYYLNDENECIRNIALEKLKAREMTAFTLTH